MLRQWEAEDPVCEVDAVDLRGTEGRISGVFEVVLYEVDHILAEGDSEWQFCEPRRERGEFLEDGSREGRAVVD